MIVDKLIRDWIDMDREVKRGDKGGTIFREYVVEKSDELTSRNANYMHFSILRKIKHRNWNETLKRQWKEDDGEGHPVWHYTTATSCTEDIKRFTKNKYERYLATGEDKNLSPDMIEVFQNWKADPASNPFMKPWAIS